MPRAGWVWTAAMWALRVLVHVLETVLHVVGGALEDRAQLGFQKRALHFPGAAHYEGSRRDHRALGDERARSNDGFASDPGPVQQDRAHPDEASVFDHAPVQDRAVPHGHLVADEGGVRRLVVHVDDHAVLEVRLTAHPDVVHIAADHHVHPDAARRADHDVPNHLRRLVDVRRRIDRGHDVSVWANHSLILGVPGSGTASRQIFGSVTPSCAWYLPFLSL